MFSKASKTKGGSLPAAAETGRSEARREPSGVPSIISADLTIEGNLVSHGDLQVDGTVKGDIQSRTLTLGEMGKVEGAIEAETVRLCGEVDGEVRAATVVVTKTAKVRGDILHDSLAIEAGAFIDGHCRRDVVAKGAASPPGAKPSDGKLTAPAANGKVAVEPVGSETKPAI